ncbi:uncharacterized protein ARMOST_20070 [Armillaria ostoyae]|uniref:Uncharacterized protein n=1 Tax=Armillaria ostoyae TaxID=47428 RepID=A0A284S6A5_ARMOS|nr:uncharacterized protein ARMOST_20070 [Armillaria ostoyae]
MFIVNETKVADVRMVFRRLATQVQTPYRGRLFSKKLAVKTRRSSNIGNPYGGYTSEKELRKMPMVLPGCGEVRGDHVVPRPCATAKWTRAAFSRHQVITTESLLSKGLRLVTSLFCCRN